MYSPGGDLYYDPSLSSVEKWYCSLWGIPIVGLRIRLRHLAKHIPQHANAVLDAGCGRGVISRYLSKRYDDASVLGIDVDEKRLELNQVVARSAGLTNCRFECADLVKFVRADTFDLIISVDNLEHIEDDEQVLKNFYESMQPGGTLYLHVPHYYRRWPLLHWTVNFDVPGHVRPGYHMAEIRERVERAGFSVNEIGFSYGFLENLSNNISYWITGAQEQRKTLYAFLFPLLNALAWLGQWGQAQQGAGVWLVATKSQANGASRSDDA